MMWFFDDKFIKLFDAVLEIRDMYRDNIPVDTDVSRDGNSVACSTVFPSNPVISMRLPDSQHPCLLLRYGQNIQLHPNTLFSQTHFRVGKRGSKL